MKCVRFKDNEKYIKDFISLPKKLYDDKYNMEDKEMIKSLLKGEHPLNKYFTLDKFLIYKDDEVVGRFIITEYPDDKDVCYIGFFECVEDKKVAKFLFSEADKFAKKKGYKKIVGPVDASFWIKYRLKNLFEERPYTGEPYNLDYYLDLFTDNKYKVVEHYISHLFKEAVNYENKKFTEHFKEFMEKGYEIVKPEIEDFDKCIEEIYYMIMDLYKDFPIFKKLELDDFVAIFSSYKKIINMDMVRMAYYKGKPVAFYISVPDYNNMVYHLNLFNIMKILKLKKHPKRYVMLYMGVDREHLGLGKAISMPIIEELKKNKLPSIGALQRDGNLTQKYGDDHVKYTFEYVLLERDL